MQPVPRAEPLQGEKAADVDLVGRRESMRLEIGETPPGFAHRRPVGDRASVGRRGFLRPTTGAQGVTVAQQIFG